MEEHNAHDVFGVCHAMPPLREWDIAIAALVEACEKKFKRGDFRNFNYT